MTFLSFLTNVAYATLVEYEDTLLDLGEISFGNFPVFQTLSEFEKHLSSNVFLELLGNFLRKFPKNIAFWAIIFSIWPKFTKKS